MQWSAQRALLTSVHRQKEMRHDDHGCSTVTYAAACLCCKPYTGNHLCGAQLKCIPGQRHQTLIGRCAIYLWDAQTSQCASQLMLQISHESRHSSGAMHLWHMRVQTTSLIVSLSQSSVLNHSALWTLQLTSTTTHVWLTRGPCTCARRSRPCLSKLSGSLMRAFIQTC